MAKRDRIALESGGIVAYWREKSATPILVRLRDANGDLEVSEIYLPPSGVPYSDRLLRQISIDRITELANEPLSQMIIQRLIQHKRSPTLEAAADRFIAEGPPTLDKPPSAWLVNRPVKRPYPDEFFKEVAFVYRRLVETERDPAMQIADANGVPVTTVHRWVREARDRGHLGKAMTGRRGEKKA